MENAWKCCWSPFVSPNPKSGKLSTNARLLFPFQLFRGFSRVTRTRTHVAFPVDSTGELSRAVTDNRQQFTVTFSTRIRTHYKSYLDCLWLREKPATWVACAALNFPALPLRNTYGFRKDFPQSPKPFQITHKKDSLNTIMTSQKKRLPWADAA